MNCCTRCKIAIPVIAVILIGCAVGRSRGDAGEEDAKMQHKGNRYLPADFVIDKIEYIPNGGEAIVITDAKKLRGVREALDNAKVVSKDAVPFYTAKLRIKSKNKANGRVLQFDSRKGYFTTLSKTKTRVYKIERPDEFQKFFEAK